MNHTSRIIGGIAFLAFGIGWLLELTGVVNINLDGWWTLFIIIPCFAALFGNKNKCAPLIGLGVGILMLLCTRDVIPWYDFWKYAICLVAMAWGLTLLLGNRKGDRCRQCDSQAVDNLEQINQEGRQIQRINVTFGKQRYEFGGRRFEGADVQTSFGFTALDLRNADLLDGAVINLDCSFGGMEIRVDRDVCVKTTVETSFAGIESQCDTTPSPTSKTLYLRGHCSFGGIEIK